MGLFWCRLSVWRLGAYGTATENYVHAKDVFEMDNEVRGRNRRDHSTREQSYGKNEKNIS
jgi:hypothetical protein